MCVCVFAIYDVCEESEETVILDIIVLCVEDRECVMMLLDAECVCVCEEEERERARKKIME